MDALRQALNHAQEQRGRFVAQLREFLRFPSVSSQPRHAGDVGRCASWLAIHLRSIGLQNVQVIPTAGHPIVYADWRKRPDRPTLLIYGHYDVQPADPLSEWHSPPFTPTIRGQDLFARGASDDKGQMFVHVKALECYLSTGRTLPVNVKCLFEGEEEVGSTHLSPVLQRNRRALAATAAVLSDTQMLGPDRPAITYGLRGNLACQLTVMGPKQDLHSGVFGGG
ncbi:MAG TPA: M20/M25/M40 family metallo-hydrolase, partial [Gemmataceae bacterium]|nr:M20/M25/M40 family metallo-hydrolase [Gemmataceae bacterium]